MSCDCCINLYDCIRALRRNPLFLLRILNASTLDVHFRNQHILHSHQRNKKLTTKKWKQRQTTNNRDPFQTTDRTKKRTNATAIRPSRQMCLCVPFPVPDPGGVALLNSSRGISGSNKIQTSSPGISAISQTLSHACHTIGAHRAHRHQMKPAKAKSRETVGQICRPETTKPGRNG